MTSGGVLDRILLPDPPPFALLYRPGQTAGVVDVIVGQVETVESLAGLPLPDFSGSARPEMLAMVPYRQIGERGFAGNDDGTPLLALRVQDWEQRTLAEIFGAVPVVPLRVQGGGFDVSDEDFADTVRRVVSQEIGQGAGANFVVSRCYSAELHEFSPAQALTVFRNLLEREQGTYWTFVVHTGDVTLVGATPERHISVLDGVATMNPISGTYRYPQDGPELDELIDFLGDEKEIDELYMVVDEELKMMARICPSGVRVDGPYLKEMARLAHTEYFISGHTAMDPRDILRTTMFAPTVTGSPLENACRVITRYEPRGRGYYSGVLALMGHHEDGSYALDSSILIRMAEIDRGGRMRVRVGATLVRHSDPLAEAAETRAKAAGLLAAVGSRRLGDHPDVRAALRRRNDHVARFWLGEERTAAAAPALVGRNVLVVDAEDDFTAMLALQLRSFGLTVDVCGSGRPYRIEDYDLVLLGPGPGNPADRDDERVRHLEQTVRRLLDEQRPFLAVCLSHQVLSRVLGFPLRRRETPNQGVQRVLPLFGEQVRVGFYNTFNALSATPVRICDPVGPVEVSRDELTGEVYALRGNGFRSVQFHAESLLSEDGSAILRRMLLELLPVPSIA
ncbi:chorismate-binding protein [Nocardia sp. BMG51109]|uniref:chorismate-binding protein n=1 Tax=Nocardia sp. BMG51109 TaxID=1056816 RepID=UPI000463ED2C|nr:chorismate-binding protein [Nocardia sp. BMG51109]